MKGWIFILGLILLCTGSALTANADHRPFATLPSPSTVYTLTGTGRLPSTDDGAKLYEFWCSTCHGDRGQGLTADWRAQWPEGKQNCWQSKCHAGNHPPDGFSFPKQVPALIGPGTLAKFPTAQDLYAYARATMPYWSPNLLTDDEYQAITIFLVKANYEARDLPVPTGLAQDLSAVYLSPHLQMGGTSRQHPEISGKRELLPSEAITSVIPSTSNSQLAASGSLILLWISLIVLGGSFAIVLARRFSSRSQ
ncbi:MAG: c-type cytochrome [Anaerolineae bacterium]|nr:c-type cytochrome [Anaerolineae bacterium]